MIDGVHPKTLRAYTWRSEPPAASELTTITQEQASAFLDEVVEFIHSRHLGTATRTGGNHTVAPDQADLLAPSVEALREVVSAIPNTK